MCIRDRYFPTARIASAICVDVYKRQTMRQTAILRPRSKSKKVKNMYFVGQYTQPGIGVPIVVISAQLVAERIRKDYA